MEDFLKLIEVICDLVFSIDFMGSKSNKDESLPPFPGEGYVALLLLLFFAIVAFLLHFIIKMDAKSYFGIAVFLVIIVTFIFFGMIRRAYYYYLLKKIRRDNDII